MCVCVWHFAVYFQLADLFYLRLDVSFTLVFSKLSLSFNSIIKARIQYKWLWSMSVSIRSFVRLPVCFSERDQPYDLSSFTNGTLRTDDDSIQHFESKSCSDSRTNDQSVSLVFFLAIYFPSHSIGFVSGWFQAELIKCLTIYESNENSSDGIIHIRSLKMWARETHKHTDIPNGIEMQQYAQRKVKEFRWKKYLRSISFNRATFNIHACLCVWVFVWVSLSLSCRYFVMTMCACNCVYLCACTQVMQSERKKT